LFCPDAISCSFTRLKMVPSSYYSSSVLPFGGFHLSIQR
jgi:hypothetical protein